MTTTAPTRRGSRRTGPDDGVTVVLPAYREEANLTQTVEDMLGTLGLRPGEPHQVVIVNDGSPDATGEIADTPGHSLSGAGHRRPPPGEPRLRRRRPDGHRERHLEQTDSRRLFLTDSDGQFSAAQLPDFIREAHAERADAVIGYRKKRADPLQRKINATLWGWACKLLLRIRARDVDCAYKLVDRAGPGRCVRCAAEAGTISPGAAAAGRETGCTRAPAPRRAFPPPAPRRADRGQDLGDRGVAGGAGEALSSDRARKPDLARPPGPARPAPGRPGARRGNPGGRRGLDGRLLVFRPHSRHPGGP